MQISGDMKFDLIITLTYSYVLMDNFCPCFFSHLIPRFYLLEKLFLLLRKRNRERERERECYERVRDKEREIKRER